MDHNGGSSSGLRHRQDLSESRHLSRDQFTMSDSVRKSTSALTESTNLAASCQSGLSQMSMANGHKVVGGGRWEEQPPSAGVGRYHRRIAPTPPSPLNTPPLDGSETRKRGIGTAGGADGGWMFSENGERIPLILVLLGLEIHSMESYNVI